jgi:hypothetical protein
VPIVEVGFAGIPGITNAADTLVLIGPGITVEIGFDPATFAGLAGIPIPAPAPGAVAAPIVPQVVLALIDTGAQQSMIDEALAVQLTLPLINRQPYSGVGGPGIANVLPRTHNDTAAWHDAIWGLHGRSIARRRAKPLGFDWPNTITRHPIGI